MAYEFDVSFQRSIEGVIELSSRIHGAGKAMDELSRSGQVGAQRYGRGLDDLRGKLRKLEDSLAHNRELQEAFAASSEVAEKTARQTYQRIAQGAADANAKAAILQDTQSGLRQTLIDTAAAQEYSRRELRRMAKETLSYRDSAANLRSIITQMTKAEEEQALTGQKLAWGYQRLSQEAASLTAQEQQARSAIDSANRAMVEGEKNLQDYTGANHQAALAARRLAQEESAAAGSRKHQLDELRRAVQERAEADDRYQANARQAAEATRLQTAAEARLRVERDRQVAGAQAYNESLQRQAHSARDAELATGKYAAQLKRLQASVATGSAGTLNHQLAEMSRAGRQATATLGALSKEEAQLQAREKRLTDLLELRNRATALQAQANATLTSSEARQARQLRENIELYQRQAKYAAMSNAQLLGLSKGHTKLSRDLHVNAQAAAAFRAALGGLNASIGIYTSATVLTASVTFGLAAALRETVSAGAEFTETMSRAEAIMMSGAGHLTDSVSTMGALEQQVRSLGQSTIFTATETAAGLVDLGMAGLSSAEALSALKPALDLASIGAIDMSQSADIATNVMTTFRISASELGEVVDVLATAVTNSNTDILKLANALSYVGPAAKAAGFELRDTVAAIELLSNAGIKSSKAGTGLRRFMLNIQNPTSKGAEVLAKYNIALDDATGQTRGLIDILGQFNESLHRDGIAPAERMAAIVDLVGVRAASAVSRMVSSVDDLGVLRRQLDNVSGAAEEMREKIEDNLASDWKKVKSSFQDLQLEVFKEFQWELRTLSARWTETFQRMTIEDAQGISQLDRYIAQLTKLSDVALGAGVALAALKGGGTSFNMLSALANNAGAAADRMNTLARRSKAAMLMQVRQTRVIEASSAAIHGQTNAMISWHAGTLAMTRAMQGLATAGMWVSRSLGWITRAAGWIGLVWGLYESISAAFSDTDGYIDSHKDRIQNLKDEYSNLADQIERTQREKSRNALQAQRTNSREELARTDQQILDLRNARGVVQGADSLQSIDDRLAVLQRRREELNQTFLESGEALSELGSSSEDLASLVEQQDFWASKIAESNRELERWGELEVVPSMTFQAKKNIEAWREMQQVARGYFAFINRRVEEAQREQVTFMDDLNAALEEQRSKMDEENRFENLSVTQQMVELQEQLAEAKAKVAEMDAESADEQSLSRYQRVKEEVLELGEQLNETRYEYQELAQEGSATYKELLELQRRDADSLEDLRSRLAGVNAMRMGMIAQAVVGNTELDVERVNELLERQIELVKGIQQAEEDKEREADRAARRAERAAEREARELESKMDEYRSILDSADEVRAATSKFADQQKSLQSLLDGGHISQDDYEAALDIVREKFWDNVAAGDAYLKTLRDLNEEWENGGPALDAGGWVRKLQVADTYQQSDNEITAGRGRLLEQQIRLQKEDDAESAVPGHDPDARFEDNQFGEANRLRNLSYDTKREAGMAIDDLRLQEEQATHDGRLEAAEEFARQREQIEENLQNRLRQIDEQSNRAMLQGASQSFGDLANITKAFAGEQSALYQSMFAASKAFAIAESIISINLAIAKATASGATWQEQLAAMATITSATAGIVSNIQSVSMAASGSEDSGGGDPSYAGMYDKGGQIPSGQYGVVGEYGPEIVHGPANVTGRKETARKMGGGGELKVEFAPQFNIDMSGSGDEEEDARRADQLGKDLNKKMEHQFMQLMHREMRPNGVLDRWKRSPR